MMSNGYIGNLDSALGKTRQNMSIHEVKFGQQHTFDYN
jgi:hypothetical protein